MSSLDLDIIPKLLVRTVAVDIIKAVSLATNTDPDVLARLIPGLQHDHWYVPATRDPVPGCAYCARTELFGSGCGKQ